MEDTNQNRTIEPADTDAEPATNPVGGTLASVTGEVQDAVSMAADRAREQVVATIEGQKERAAEGLGEVAEALRQTTATLREHNVAPLAPAIETAADRVAKLSEYLLEADLDEIADEVNEIARKRPAAYLLGAFAIGFVGGRLLLSGNAARRRQAPPKAA